MKTKAFSYKAKCLATVMENTEISQDPETGLAAFTTDHLSRTSWAMSSMRRFLSGQTPSAT
ncbi:MAG: hypothetical protein BWY65_01495 [Firmicutes bacterium ADurb.Bin373]|nr:MAG: hypothetical protein BWY65_01495 [Firmicutes bacterium ADurb.Bin373]